MEVKVKTLEEIHYPNLYYQKATDDDEQIENISNVTEQITQTENLQEEKSQEEKSKHIDFKEKHFVIEEDEIGITYKKLFGHILKGAKHIEVIDPYIRNFFQTLNFMEFLEVVEKCKAEEDEVVVELTTSVDEFNEVGQTKNLETIREVLY